MEAGLPASKKLVDNPTIALSIFIGSATRLWTHSSGLVLVSVLKKVAMLCLYSHLYNIMLGLLGALKVTTPSKNNLFRKSNARDHELHHENSCVKASSQLRGEHCKCSSDFSPSECPGLCST